MSEVSNEIKILQALEKKVVDLSARIIGDDDLNWRYRKALEKKVEGLEAKEKHRIELLNFKIETIASGKYQKALDDVEAICEWDEVGRYSTTKKQRERIDVLVMEQEEFKKLRK